MIIVSLTILALAVLGFNGWVVYRLLRLVTDLMSQKVSPTSPVNRPEEITPDQYNPEDSDGTVPLDQFEPDFSKPIVMKTKLVSKETDEGSSLEEVEDNG